MLYQEDIIYRPPFEAESMLIEVTIGCTYGKCTFCMCSSGEREFEMIPMDTLEENIQILGIHEWHKTSAFLLGENVFALSTERLKAIFQLINKYAPNVNKISMYSRAVDVLSKSKAELMQLKILGLGDLYIGIESGNDEILKACEKGETVAELREALNLLDEMKIGYGLSSIFGLGGKKRWQENAIDTAEFYNSVNPKNIRVMTLTALENTKLFTQIQSGEFIEQSPGEILLEERLFLENLNVTDCVFLGTHVSNNVPLVGILPKHKEALLGLLDEVISVTDLETLQKTSFQQW